MTRYRKSPANNTITGPVTVSSIPAAVLPNIPAKGSKKTINYIWMPDKDGNLVKKDSAIVKRTFAKLSEAAQSALAEYIIAVQNRQPTDASRKTVFNGLVDAAVASYKEGKKQTPWDILKIQLDNAPKITDKTIAYSVYDKATTDATLRKIAKDLGFAEGGFGQFGEQDLQDFFNKVQEASKAGAKETQVVIRPDGTQETITVPAAFDLGSFAQNYLWSKVNIGDPKTLPSSVIKQTGALRSLLRANGLQLSDKELNQISYDLTRGNKDMTALQSEFAEMAAKLYPQYADRLRATPGLTVREVASPILNTIANAWEIDPDTLELDDPMIDQFIRPDGVVGKAAPKSNYEVYTWAMNHPNREKTMAEIMRAQQAATQLASALGFGV